MATYKQKRVAKRITENHGNVSKTMLEEGYSPNTAKKPSNLTNSKGWKELVEKELPDDFLLKKHKQLLNSPDVDSIGRGLDMGYKLKGKYAPAKFSIETPEDELTDEQLEQQIKDLEGKRKERLHEEKK